ncbi:MAG: protein kinase [Deltaproteobacteria bacterium]|nr:protein kinase [Nannocystaceae bacterium]
MTTTSPTRELPESTGMPTGLLAGRYQAISLLGQGAMGDVYLARHVHAGRVVALKVVSSSFASDQRICERVRAEAQACSAARHPNIVEVFDAGELEDGRPYVAMEYLDGKRLLDLFESEGPLPIARACRLMLDVTRAIAAAHKVGIIHRDLKAENVMLVVRDGVEVIKVLDFGIAAAVAREGGRATMPGIGIGTPEYMAPEQVYGADPTPRFDVYAIGVMLFEAITGTLPFTGDSASVILQRKATSPAPPISDHRRDVPATLAKLIDQCLALDPEDRPSTADEVARVLEAFVDERPSAIERPQSRRSGLWITLGAAAVAAFFAVLLVRPSSLRTSVPALARLAAVSQAVAKPPAPPAPTALPAAPVVAPPEEPELDPVEVALDPEPSTPRVGAKKPRKQPALPTVSADSPSPAVTKPTPDEAAETEECARLRAQADDARQSHDWNGVLRSTERGACWKSSRDRARMRVKAFLELHRFAQCKHAAGSIEDSEIQRDAKICEKRMTVPG